MRLSVFALTDWKTGFWLWSRPGIWCLIIEFYLIKLVHRKMMLLAYYYLLSVNPEERPVLGLAENAWHNTHQASIFIFLFLSYQPFLKLLLFDHHPEPKLNLICAETWPAGRSCLSDDINWVEKYRPPLAPMPILSLTAAITLLSCGQPRWHHPLN